MTEDEEDERLGGLPDLEEPQHVEQKRTRKKLTDKDKEKALSDAYLEILNSKAGRLVLYDRLDKAGYWLIPYDPASPHNTAYLVGNNAMARELYDDLWAASSDLVLTMLKENRT